jgi:hypothetical protein
MSTDVSLKRGGFYVATVLLVLLFVELNNQIIYYFYFGHALWAPPRQEQFALKNLTEPVSDARAFTIRPNFSDPSFHRGWQVSADAWGFRRGTYVTDPSRPSVVFIGDSVPFGWGVGDESTMASRLFDRLQAKGDPRGAVNAAIPSYTLIQTAARYEIQVHGRLKVDSVYLQIYNPVNQLLLRGHSWRPSDTWANVDVIGYEQKPFFLSEYSATSAILENGAYRFLGDQIAKTIFGPPAPYKEVLNPDDSALLDQFRREVRAELERLHEMILADGSHKLVVAPITVRKSAREAYSAARRVAVQALNDELRRFAAAHGDVAYLDAVAVLDKLPEDDVFVDECCHLTRQGNDIIAEQLLPLL